MHPRESLKILAAQCPVYPAPQSNCPLATIRKIPLTERNAYIDFLPENDVEFLVRNHILCACQKDGCHTEPAD